MNIRPANVVDIDYCERLDGSYTTDYVWQMDETISKDSRTVTFRRVRTPRRMAVDYPRKVEDLEEDWQRQECFLVACEFGRVLAYLDMVVRRWRWQGWIEHLVVDPACRREGVAIRLLKAAERWARGSELGAICVFVQSKNDPAISLFSKCGYTFQGFIDHYYNNNDAGILYSLYL